MKKKIAILLMLSMVVASTACGCGKKDEEIAADEEAIAEETEEEIEESNDANEIVVAEEVATVDENANEPEVEEEPEEDVVINPIAMLVDTVALSSSLTDGKLCMTGEKIGVKMAPKKTFSFSESAKEHEAAAARIDSIMADYSAQFEDSYNETLDMVNDLEDLNYLPFSFNSNVSVVRADSRVISMVLEQDYYSGGAHPGCYVWTESIDAMTGEDIKLSDVVKDTSVLPKMIIDNIPDDVDLMVEDDYFEDGVANNALSYVVDNCGLTFYFAPYEIAPWACGTVTVTIPFFNNDDIFNEYYTWALDAYASTVIPAIPYMDYTVTKGEVTPLYVYNSENANGLITSISVNSGDFRDSQDITAAKYVTYEYVQTIDFGRFFYADAVTAKGEETLYVWKISSDGSGIKYMGKKDNIGMGLYPESIGDYDYYELIMHPEGMILSQNGSNAEYYIGEDGMPQKASK